MIPIKSWTGMPLMQRIQACHVDIMNHPDFALLAGVVCSGEVVLDPTLRTAATDGSAAYYGPWCERQNQKQLRYVVLHENFHKGLKHVLLYKDLMQKYPNESNMAMDYVINGMIEETDKSFVERFTDPDPLIDPKYAGMSFIEVLRDLLKNPPKGGGGSGSGPGQPFDEHRLPNATAEEQQAQSMEMDEAMRQGALVADKIRRSRGLGKGNEALDAATQERHTNWRGPLQEFVETTCEGEEESRYNPLNRRLRPMDIIAPSHYSETIGELVVACDTSGSMGPVYPTVFGEMARICKNVQPARVRMIWWDDGVQGEQVFEPKDYDKIATLLKPSGGGGTRLSCVAEYMKEMKLKPVATVILTDGMIESEYDLPDGPVLFGVVDNPGFVPRRGKKIDINSLRM